MTKKSSLPFQSVVAYGASGISVLLGLVSYGVISHSVEPSSLGVYYLALILNGLLTYFSNLGLGAVLVTFIPKGELPVAKANGLAVVYALAIGGSWIFVTVILLPVIHHALPNLSDKFLWTAIGLLPLTLYTFYWTFLAVARGSVIVQSAIFFATSVVWYGLNLLLMAFHAGVESLLGAWVVSQILGVLCMAGLILRWEGKLFESPSGWMGRAFHFGIRSSLGEMATEIWKRLNIFFLNLFHGAGAVGIYSVADVINDKLLLFPGPMRNAVSHRVIQSEKEESLRMALKAVRHVTFLLGTGAAVLFIGAPWIVRWMYGPAYAGGAAALRIVVLGSALFGIPSILSLFFVGTLRRPGLLSVLAWLNAIFHIFVCLLLIPRWGIPGAAAAFTLTCFFGVFIQLKVLERLVGVKLRLKDMAWLQPEDRQDYVRFFRKLLDISMTSH